MSEFTLETQRIDLTDVKLTGKILDIGGGGEGVISRHSGSVVAIDWRRDELEETPDIGLKIVMDACEMGFLDAAFDTITSFYSAMYMSETNLIKFASEAYRVLKPNGLLWIWDTNLPPLAEGDVVIVPIEVRIDGQTVINAGYGIGWSRAQTAKYVVDIMERTGFTMESQMEHGEAFQLCFRRG